MSASLTQLAYQALREISNLRPGQTTSTDVINDILAKANQMLDAWQIDELLAYCYPSALYSVTPGQQQYTIGPNEVAPNWTATRPTEIRDANLVLTTVSPVLRIPLNVVNVDRWSDIAIQTLPSALPLTLYYVKDFTATGAGTINIWPGDFNADQIELFTPLTMPFTKFVDPVTVYSFPPAYELMLRMSLAVAIKPMMMLYNKLGRISWEVNEQAFAEVKEQALAARAAVESFNAPDYEIMGDPAYCGTSVRQRGFNYLLGTNGRSFR